jgi:hypothetical protein
VNPVAELFSLPDLLYRPDARDQLDLPRQPDPSRLLDLPNQPHHGDMSA